MDIEHSLLSDHGLDLTEPTVPDTLPLVHHPVHNLRLGLQNPRQHWTIGQLFAAHHHRLDGLDKIISDIVNNTITGRFITVKPLAGLMTRSVIVADFAWWIDHEQEIEQWMDANLEKGRFCRQGMVIEFDDQEDMALFLLTWQGS